MMYEQEVEIIKKKYKLTKHQENILMSKIYHLKNWNENLNTEQIVLLADPHVNLGRASKIAGLLETHHISEELMELLVKDNFTDDMFNIVEDLIEEYVPEESIMLVANNGLDSGQMSAVANGIYRHLSDDQLKFFAKPEYNREQMYQIRRGLEHLTTEQVMIYANAKYNKFQMRYFRLCLENKIPTDIFDVEKVTERGVDFFSNLLSEGITDPELAKRCLSKEFTKDQIHIISQAKFLGLNEKQIRIIINPKFSMEQMEFLVNNAKNYEMAKEKTARKQKIDKNIHI